MRDRCREIRELIPEFVAGSLATDKMIAVSYHVGQCIPCREYLLGFEADDKMLCAFAEAMEPSVQRVEEQVLDALSQRRLARALGSLSVFRRVATNKFVKVVAAAAIAVTAGIGIALLLSRPGEKKEQVVVKKIEQQPGQMPAPAAVEQADIARAKLEAELKQMEQMFAAGDVDGLVAMLSEGSLFGKVFAANYLARIGGLRAVAALEKAKDQYHWPDEDNPFAAAIDEIKSRAAAAERELVKVKPSKAEFVPVGVLSGLITDAQTGEAVSGATIQISKRRGYRAVADANGFYHFGEIAEDGGYRVGVYSSEYVGIHDWDKMPTVALRADSQVVKHFELEQGCQIDIAVVNEDGEPVPQVQLTVSWLGDEHGREIGGQFDRFQTDEQGEATLGAFEPSQISYFIAATHEDYAPAKHTVKFSDPEVIEYAEIVMQKGVSVRGYAEYSDGIPAASLEIRALPDWWPRIGAPKGYLIDADGYFTLEHIVPGGYTLRAVPPIERTAMIVDVLQTKLPLEQEALIVTIPRKSPGALASISGTIRVTGGPIPPFMEILSSSRDGGFHQTFLGGRQNKFVIDSLEPGAYTLTFRGMDIEEKVIEDVNAPSSDLIVELRYAQKPVLRGVVVRADSDETIRHFKARVRMVETLRGSDRVTGNGWAQFDDEQGWFEIETRGPGIYQVQVAAEGFAWVWSEEINTDDIEPVVVKLTAGGTIKGRVVDQSGKPISGANVLPFSKARGVRKGTENSFISEDAAVETSDGKFLLQHLAVGKETIKVTHPDYSYAIVDDIEVVEGRTTDGVEIVLTKGGAVEGYVFDAQGRPEGNVILYFEEKSDYASEEQSVRLATAVTDSNGFYRVEALPEKLCHVRRKDAWERLGVVRRAVVAISGRTAELNFGGEPVVSGQLVIDEQPLANNKVILGEVDNPYLGVFFCTAMTDSEGRFHFAGVSQGRYGIFYDDPEKKGYTKKAATIKMGEQDMDIGAVPGQMGRVVISISAAEPNETPDGVKVYLREGASLWADRVGDVSEPEREGEPFVVSNVPAGRYSVVMIRPDKVRITEAIEFLPEQDELNVSLQIPKSTAIVRGQCVGDAARGLVLWSEDRKIMAYPNPDESGAYEIRNLPAGDYSIGGNLMVSGGEYVRFSLSQGQNKTLDIDTSEGALPELSSLHTQVVGENGVPLTGAVVWLETGAELIEPLTQSGRGQYFVTEPGEYTLHAVSTGYKEARKEIWLEAKDMETIPEKDYPVMLIRLEKR